MFNYETLTIETQEQRIKRCNCLIERCNSAISVMESNLRGYQSGLFSNIFDGATFVQEHIDRKKRFLQTLWNDLNEAEYMVFSLNQNSSDGEQHEYGGENE